MLCVLVGKRSKETKHLSC